MVTRFLPDTWLGHVYTFDPMAAIPANMFRGFESLVAVMEVMVSVAVSYTPTSFLCIGAM
jgi:hypothetical protein